MRYRAHKQVEDHRNVAFNGQCVSNDARILRAQRRFVNANERFVSEPVAAGDM
jgi:hypothetical protein